MAASDESVWIDVDELYTQVINTTHHRSSRAGDPHVRLHLQITAWVWAAGMWREIHTVGVRDSLAAAHFRRSARV
jgi:exodeoxyribonuclease V alpha subunit